jgi:hypothetical protein
MESLPRAVESLSGLIERVTFHNEENGWAVLKVKGRGPATWSSGWRQVGRPPCSAATPRTQGSSRTSTA